MTGATIERILCPIDFSVFSSQALRHAHAVARAFHSRLKVVHVMLDSIPAVESVYGAAPWLPTAADRQRVEEEMHRFLAPLREARQDHESEIREGSPWREIEAAAAEIQADLVVMGTHGRSGFEHLILGSVTEKLVRRLRCPVLTVAHEAARTWAAPGLVTRILCATDFSPMAAEALRTAIAFAERHRASITLLHVVESLPDRNAAAHRALLDIDALRADLERRAEERLRAMVVEAGAPHLDFETRVLTGCAHKEILRAAEGESADLIVIGAQGRGVIDHLLSGSNTQHVIRAATCPVLTVRPAPAWAQPDEARRASRAMAP